MHIYIYIYIYIYIHTFCIYLYMYIYTICIFIYFLYILTYIHIYYAYIYIHNIYYILMIMCVMCVCNHRNVSFFFSYGKMWVVIAIVNNWVRTIFLTLPFITHSFKVRILMSCLKLYQISWTGLGWSGICINWIFFQWVFTSQILPFDLKFRGYE